MIVDIPTSKMEEKIVSGAALAITLFMVLGILERSRFLRILTLVLSWPAVAISLISLPFAYSEFEFQKLWIIYNIIILVVTIWGLTHTDSKHYYGITKKTEPT